MVTKWSRRTGTSESLLSREHLIAKTRIPWRAAEETAGTHHDILHTGVLDSDGVPPRHAARPRTRDNPCKRPSVYGSRRAKQPALSLSSLANDASHRTPAGYHYCVDNRASFLLSGITTPRPISRPAARPVIAQFFQFTGPSSRVNTENSATERRATGLTDLQGQHPDPTQATSSPCVFFLVAENPRGVKQIIYRACFMFQHRTAEDVDSL